MKKNEKIEENWRKLKKMKKIEENEENEENEIKFKFKLIFRNCEKLWKIVKNTKIQK